jgi:hypothetical protein
VAVAVVVGCVCGLVSLGVEENRGRRWQFGTAERLDGGDRS